MRGQGFQVLRMAAPDILDRPAFEGILVMIAQATRPDPTVPPPPPSAIPLPRKRGRIEAAAVPPPLLPCEAGERDHAKHCGGGLLAKETHT